MSDQPITIPKDPQFPEAEDYQLLRAEGFEAIEELGSAQWTDYNAHDPGITILEALSYALTELGYRTGFDIADLLTEPSGYISFRQALFTARRILTNNPLTVNDFRKVLIDLPNIQNGWLLCKECVCETTLYAECEDSELHHAPQWRLHPQLAVGAARLIHEHPMVPQGLYDVLLQLEMDPELGDLNNRKVVQVVNVPLPGSTAMAPLTIELRFPDWAMVNPELYARFTSNDPDFAITQLTLTRFSRDRTLAEPVDAASFAQGWRDLFFVDYSIDFQVNGGEPVETLVLESIPVRFFSPQEGVKRAPNILDIVDLVLADGQIGGIVDRYRRKLLAVAAAVEEARFALHAKRNLAEDFCRFEGIRCEDIAFCADVEVEAGADIENVLAHIYREIELHFNPPAPFHTLSEMAADGIPTEEIFEGPVLDNGFIKDDELEAARLLAVVHISDLYNRLMDIPGVVAIKNVQFTRYDDEGQALTPSHQWTIPIRPLHIPKLYREASRVLFYKDGLPFVARLDEVRAILAQLRGESLQGKVPLAERDYPIPLGTHRELAAYHPVQHTFPMTYGIGPAGLPPSANELRRAQAHHLKAYLLPYEQLIADMTEQLAHVPDLFSTDEAVDRTYFTHFFDSSLLEPEIADLAEIVTGLSTEDNLRELAEPASVYQDRRNRFLDHVLARFGEQFTDYALLLHANADRIPFAPDKLIRDKIRFLRFYPSISANRGRAFNYRDEDRVCDPRNRSGISERIARLLGLEMLKGYFSVEITSGLGQFQATFSLTRPEPGPPTVLLRQAVTIEELTGEAAEDAAWMIIGDIIANSVDPTRYTTSGSDDVLEDENGNTIAILESGVTPNDVIAFASNLLEQERLYVVEHLLLRPKFPGDAVMPVCLTPDCTLCGDEDPYSFRLTYVLQGVLEPFSYDIDLRQFADLTIRRETPAHLLPKICWVSNIKLKKDPCASLISRLSLLLQQYLTVDEETSCDCVQEIYDTFWQEFQPWATPNQDRYRPTPILRNELIALLGTITPTDFTCLTDITSEGWDEIFENLFEHYLELAQSTHLFDKLGKAWCDWLEANISFQWQPLNETLRSRTEEWLRNALEDHVKPDVCRCADLLLGYFGDQFNEWINHLVDTEADLTDEGTLLSGLESQVWDPFIDSIRTILEIDPSFCQLSMIPDGTEAIAELRELWLSTYVEWIRVSYQLNILIRVLSNLQSIYPSATIHDCDDGSDDNPDRLDNTILGTL